MSTRTPPVVLVADDSALIRFAVAQRLRAEGYEVVEHGNASPPPRETAARLACALLDLDLGDGDGIGVATALRHARPELPLAFFSATTATEVAAQAATFGPVFAKPEALEAAVAWVRASALRVA